MASTLTQTRVPLTIPVQSSTNNRSTRDAVSDSWNAAVANYEATIVPMTTVLSELLIERLDALTPFDSAETKVLDNGCGTGIVIRRLLSRFPQIPIFGVDISEGMLHELKKHIGSSNNVTSIVQDATNLKLIPSNTCTHIITVSMLQLVSDPVLAVKEMYRVAKPKGVLGFAVWEKLGFHEAWEEACRQANIRSTTSEASPFHKATTSIDAVSDLLAQSSWEEVEVFTTKTQFGWSSHAAAFEFFFNGANPHLAKLTQGLSKHEVEKVRNLFPTVLRDLWPDSKLMGDTAIVAVARKATE